MDPLLLVLILLIILFAIGGFALSPFIWILIAVVVVIYLLDHSRRGPRV